MACSSATTSTAADAATTPTPQAAGAGAPASVAAPEGDDPAADPADAVADAEDGASAADAWRDIELFDVGSGASFTLASLEGQVVAIEPMAVWCTNCKAQQDNVKQAYGDIEASEVRHISLGIDPNEDAGTLARYAERRGYEWTFTKSPAELSRSLSDLLGSQVLSPPSTPLIVLDASGEIVISELGFHGPDALLDILREAGA